MKVDELIENEKDWLSRQPRLFPDWPEGRRWIISLLDSWLAEYCDAVPCSVDEEFQTTCRERIWGSWSYHWCRAARQSKSGRVDGLSVAEQIRQGIRPTNGASLGGDPFRDLVLSESAVRCNEKALDRLYREYQSVFESEAHRQGTGVGEESQWQDLFTQLVGVDDPRQRTGKLLAFHGHSSLKTWLRRVIYRFLIDHFRKQRARKLVELAAKHQTSVSEPWYEAHAHEVEARLSLCGGLAWRRLGPRQQQLLFFDLREGFSNNQIAQLLNVSPGHASRLRSKAMERFGELVRTQLARETKSEIELYDVADAQELASCDLAQLLLQNAEWPTSFLHSRETTITHEDTMDTRNDYLLPEPDHIRVATMDESAERLFGEQREKPIESRALVVCLDARDLAARRMDLQVVERWLDEFENTLFEQYNRTDKKGAYSPRLAVACTSDPDTEFKAAWPRAMFFIAGTGDVRASYRHTLATSLQSIFQPANSGVFTSELPEEMKGAERLPLDF